MPSGPATALPCQCGHCRKRRAKISPRPGLRKRLGADDPWRRQAVFTLPMRPFEKPGRQTVNRLPFIGTRPQAMERSDHRGALGLVSFGEVLLGTRCELDDLRDVTVSTVSPGDRRLGPAGANERAEVKVPEIPRRRITLVDPLYLKPTTHAGSVTNRALGVVNLFHDANDPDKAREEELVVPS